MNFVQNRQRNHLPMRKSVEDILSGSHEVLNNSIGQAISITNASVLQSSPITVRRRRSPSPNPTIITVAPTSSTPHSSPKAATATTSKERIADGSASSGNERSTNEGVDLKCDSFEDTGKSSDSSSPPGCLNDTNKSLQVNGADACLVKSSSKIPDRAKKTSWYSVFYPSYKSRSVDFKKLFKGVPDDERLIVDYSCALQKDILVHGRLYVSQNYLCFYANIFRWETCLSVKWKDVTAITKEKTALVIPNAILVCTETEKHFITSFATRDKAYLMLFRVWQNALMDKPMQPQEMWQWVHDCYGDELGLTSDDEDYIDPYKNKKEELSLLLDKSKNKSVDSFSEQEHFNDSLSDMAGAVRSSDSPSVGAKDKTVEKEDQRVRKVTKATRNKREDATISEQLPTDISDSSDSENEKNIPFVSTAECNSMHEGRQLVHTILPINVDTLLNLIFSKSKFLVDFHLIRKTTDMVHFDWAVNEEGLKQRKVTLTVALTQAVGPKCSHVTEVQVMRDCSQPGELYSIDITSSNAGIPYADSFFVQQHYCLVRTVDDHTMFSVHAQIKYKKSVWGVVKGFIDKNTWAGLEDFYTALVRALQTEYCIPPAKAKGRRPRRGTVMQTKVADEITSCKTPVVVAPEATVTATAKPKLKKPTHESLILLIICIIIGLGIFNGLLFYKLYSLQQWTIETSNRLPDFTLLKDPPKSHDEWLKLLRHQEALHATEMMKWQQVLQTAIELLRKTEYTLSELLLLIQVQPTQNNANVKDTLTNAPNYGEHTADVEHPHHQHNSNNDNDKLVETKNIEASNAILVEL